MRDLSEVDACESASSITFQVVWSGRVGSGVETNELWAAVGCRSKRLNQESAVAMSGSGGDPDAVFGVGLQKPLMMVVNVEDAGLGMKVFSAA